MVNFTHFPVFEANQVLRNDHLNDLVSYLEEQNRLTRNGLIGVGILCGFKVEFDADNEVLLLSEGVGVTSKGYLISTPPVVFAGIKPYTLGAPDGVADGELTQLEMDILNNEPYTERVSIYRELAEVYEFFKSPSNPNELVPLQELIAEEDMDSDIKRINIDELEGKVLLAYIKLDLESLKNCTIQDCNDKGARLRFNLRFLVMEEQVASFILNKEKEKYFNVENEENRSKRPIHLFNHPRFQLPEVALPHYGFANNPPGNIHELARIHYSAIKKGLTSLKPALIKSAQYYRYLLQAVYPEGENFENLVNQFETQTKNYLTNAPEKIQYHYDFVVHLIQAYEEFRQAAIEYDAECLPHDSYFPRHLFLGKMNSLDQDLAKKFEERSSFILTGNGFVPTEVPDKYRHYFTPSPAFNKQNILTEKIMALHYRLDRMLQRFNSNLVVQRADIQIVPGEGLDEVVSKRAIPGYFKVPATGTLDDFFRVWSYEKTTSNRLNTVRSVYRINAGNHPLRFRASTDEFYRIEGHVGRQLEKVSAALFDFQKKFGLDFGIELVELGDTASDNKLSTSLFKNYVGQHPGLTHLGGVHKGGTFIVVFQRNNAGNPVVVADFALPYNCCGKAAGTIIEECTYKWISSKRYLRNIARPWHGSATPSKRYHYSIQISNYTIGGVALIGKSIRTLDIPIENIKRYGLRAVTDTLNNAFPNGLVFGVDQEGGLTIRKYLGQDFSIEIRERNNSTRFVYTEKGRAIIGSKLENAYSDADCRIIPPDYDGANYQALHRSYGTSFYRPTFLLNTDWKDWNKAIEARMITSADDDNLDPIREDIGKILNALRAVDSRAKVALVGSWAQGTWVSKRTLNNSSDRAFLAARSKILGKTGVSDLDVLIELSSGVAIDKVAEVLNELVLEYRVSPIFGSMGSQRGEVIKLN
jgi:hypothetical protein